MHIININLKKIRKPFSKQERVSFLTTIAFLSLADDEFSQIEQEYFYMKGRELGLDEETTEKILHSVFDGTVDINTILLDLKGIEIKNELLRELLILCYIDGDYSLAEKMGMRDICCLLDIDNTILEELEQEIKDNPVDINKSKIYINLSQTLDAGKENAIRVKEKADKVGKESARFIANGIGMIGSKISFSLVSLKKMKEENKTLRDELKKITITETVKQKVLTQLQLKIDTLSEQLKEEKKKNKQNEEMIAELQIQIADLMDTIQVVENAKIA